MKLLGVVVLALLASCGQGTPAPADLTGAALKAAVQHYYAVFDRVRLTGQAGEIDEVTDPQGYDRANVEGFVLVEKTRHKSSRITAESFTQWRTVITGDTARVYFNYQPRGYDVDPATGLPLESEITLPLDHVVIELRRHGHTWLVFSRQRQ